jgi:hypothetical protein
MNRRSRLPRQLVSELADAEAAVPMGLGPAKNIRAIAKSKEALHPFVLRQFTQPADDGGINGKKLTQASS